MTKSELKTGMVVTYRNGRKAMVFKECYPYIVATEVGTWSDLRLYNTDLTVVTGERDFDIMQVELAIHPRFLWMPYDHNHYTVIWKRSSPKKMTVAEIEAILGYPVEIISEKEN